MSLSLSKVIEGVLFASAKPLSVSELMPYMPEDVGEDVVAQALETLQAEYEDRGIVLTNHGGEWGFRSNPDLADILEPLRVEPRALSRAAMETLAVIAYHQPLTRAEIENIRGVASGKGTLDILVEAGWVKPGRRRDVPGRPLTWVTTSAFLHHFSLASIKDLPGLEELEAAGLLDRRPSIETLPETGELFTEENDDIDEDNRKEENGA